MLGYLRWELVADELSEIVSRMVEFADRDGFDIAAVHYECGSRIGALNQLVGELERSQTRHVIIPSPRHLFASAQERREMLDRLAALQAQVWWLDEESAFSNEGAGQTRLPSATGWADGYGLQLGETFLGRPHWDDLEPALAHLDSAAARAGLDALVEPLRSIVEAYWHAAVGAAEAVTVPIYAAVDAEVNQLSIRMLQRTTTLLVVAEESRDHANEPLCQGILSRCIRAGRMRDVMGGTVTWCELALPFAAAPVNREEAYRDAASLLSGSADAAGKTEGSW